MCALVKTSENFNSSKNAYPNITVGVITHANTFVNFEHFLVEFAPALHNYPGQCELIVVNNSGEAAAKKTENQIEQSRVRDAGDVKLLSSMDNNIATGRNLVLTHATHDFVAFIDDDEFPVPLWLVHLMDVMQQYECQMVAGPTNPLYLFDTPKWMRNIDLHRTEGKITGQLLENCGAGNVLIEKSSIVGDFFNTDFGHSGGEDTEFFMRQIEHGLKLRWSDGAATFEYIPQSKSTGYYQIKRAMQQGQINRRILTFRGDIHSQTAYSLRSLLMITASIIIAPVLLLIAHPKAGNWVIRGFANLGHLVSVQSSLYGNVNGKE